jgi:iron complex outermembrane receptor protein
MHKPVKKHLFVKHPLSLAILPMLAFSAGAVAQTGISVGQQSEVRDMSTLQNLEEIVVTARRVEESLQDSPVSISVLRDTAIDRAGITNVADLAKFTPNMTFTAGESGRLAAPVIRGLGVIDTRGFDNSVGVFVDGIFVSGRAAQNVGMLDLQRVEVVRGPQSALYGRNTFAGAINYVTKRPTDEFEGKVEATVATDNLFRIKGSVSGPLGGGFYGRLAALHEDDDGTYENAGPLGDGDGLGGQENDAVHGRLIYDPEGPWAFELTGFYAQDHGDSRALSPVANNCGQLDPNQVNFLSRYDQMDNAYYCGKVPAADSDKLPMSPKAYAWDGETTRFTLGGNYEFNSGYFAELTLSYTDSENKSQTDVDVSQVGEPHYGYMSKADYAQGNPFFITSGFQEDSFNTYISNPGLDQKYYSAEFNFSSPRDRDLRWMVGAFYFTNENKDKATLGIDASSAVAALGLPTEEIQFLVVDSPIPFVFPEGTASPQFLDNSVFINGVGQSTLTEYDLTVDQISVFGSLEYDFTDQLTGTLELRYTNESQEVDNLVDKLGGSPPSTVDSSSNYIDPRAILRYTVSDALMVYGSAAHGTRSGGINPLVTDAAFSSFDEETNWTYELGFKSTLNSESSGNQVVLNMSVFYIDWSDAQFRQKLASAPGSFITATTNASGITSKGVEIELATRLTEHFFINGSYGYADATFDDGTYSSGNTRLCATIDPIDGLDCAGLDLDGDGSIETTAPDLSGNQLRRTARHTANLGIQYMQQAFGDTRFMARVDTSYRSKMYTDLENLQYTPAATNVNLRIGLEAPTYDVYLWVDNLTDNDAIESTNTFNSDFNSFNYVTTAVNIPQRRYGLTVGVRF